MMIRIIKHKYLPVVVLVFLIAAVYYQFFLFGKIPIPADTLVGAYYPWLDYKWGYPAGVPVKNPPISDVFSQFFLWKYLSVDIIKSGSWPLWNPYSFSGTPLLATYHSATLLPANLLLFLPKYFGWGIYIFGQTLLAALGMYLLLGKYVKDGISRIAGSLVFSLSGLMTTWTEFGTGVWAAAALPWIFFCLESYLGTKLIRYMVFLNLGFVWLFLAGHTQLTLYSSLLLLVFLVFKLWKKQISLRSSGLPIIFWLLAVVISSFQILPTLDLSNLTIRADEIYSSTFNFGLNQIYDFIRLFAADFFGNPTTYNYWGSVSYHEQTIFLGTLTLPIIIPLLLKFRKKIFWSGVFLVSLFLAWDNPVTAWFYSLPIPLLTYSSASRIFFITSFSAGILMALGLENLKEDEQFRSLVRRWTLVLIGILVLFLAGATIQSTKQNFLISLKNSAVPISLLGILFSALFNFKKKWVLYIIVGLLFFDLGRYFLKYNPFISQDLIFPTTPTLEYLKNQPWNFRIARADWEILPPNTWINYNLSSVEGYDPMALLNYAKLFNIINGDNYINRTTRYVMLRNYPSKYLDSLNTKYFLAIKRERKEATNSGLLNPQILKSNYKQVFEDKNSIVFENPDVKERAYFVPQVTSVSNQNELIKMISQKDFDPTKKAILVGNINGNFGIGEVTINNLSSNLIQINTKTKEAGFLILANTFEKGWQLQVNGTPAKLYEVNGALQGFEVPVGKTKFELSYWPKSFERGLILSGAGLTGLILISLYAKLKRIW